MSPTLTSLGGRKFAGFLLLVAVVVLFVLTGKITTEATIRDLLLGLFAIVSGFNVVQKWVTKPSSPATPSPKETTP